MLAHDIGKEIIRPLKVNWADCINFINDVSKVITDNPFQGVNTYRVFG